jgi:lipoprotein-releasing system permease protein
MIFLAFRYLLERKRQTFFTLFGVFLGSMAYVSVSGFFVGFHTYVIQQLVNNSAQVHIQARQDYLTHHELDESFYTKAFQHVFWDVPPSGAMGFLEVQNPQSWYERLKKDPRVEAFSPMISAPVLFRLSKISVSAALTGCNPFQQSKVTSIAEYMVEGKFNDIGAGGNRLILGDELMKRLGAGIGQTIQVSVGNTESTPFKVVGRYYFGNRAADSMAFGAIQDVQKLNGTPNRVTEISVRLKDYTQAASIATAWSELAPERTESWDQQNLNFFYMIRIQNALRFSMISAILIVAGFGIYNVLNMTVNQKRQDIAILRSMGYDTLEIITLFFAQGLILGAIGAAFGLIFGYLFCRYLKTISFMMKTASNPDGNLMISLDPWIYVQGAILALVAASLASILPAKSAGKLTPIEIIRSGG